MQPGAAHNLVLNHTWLLVFSCRYVLILRSMTHLLTTLSGLCNIQGLKCWTKWKRNSNETYTKKIICVRDTFCHASHMNKINSETLPVNQQTVKFQLSVIVYCIL